LVAVVINYFFITKIGHCSLVMISCIFFQGS